MKLREAYKRAKEYNNAILNSNDCSMQQIAYKLQKKNYSEYNIEAIPVINLHTMNALKLTTDFRSGFIKSFVRKYTNKGYKKWAKI